MSASSNYCSVEMTVADKPLRRRKREDDKDYAEEQPQENDDIDFKTIKSKSRKQTRRVHILHNTKSLLTDTYKSLLGSSLNWVSKRTE